MKYRYFSGCCLFLGVLGLRAQEPPRPAKVDRICGYLRQEKQNSDKRHPNSTQYAKTSVAKVSVRLYPREAAEGCCSQMSPLAEALTGKNGKFEIKKIPPGNHWIAAVIDNRECKMQIAYRPVKENQSDCEEHPYTLDKSGNFVLQTLITVTVT
jgi:hypothetical protein